MASSDADEVGVIGSILPAITVDGRRGVILGANQGAHEMLGYAMGELVGEPLDILIPERSRKVHRHERLAYMNHPEPRPMGSDREVFIRCKDGSEKKVWIGLAPVDDKVVAAVLYVGGEQPGPLNP